MKVLRFFPVLLLFVFASCSTVRVASDYDTEANFTSYNSFAFYRPGIDKTKVNDIDKKRILRAIESNLIAKGFNKNESPDILVSIFTKESERVDVYQNNFGWGGAWGWGGPWGWGGNWGNTVSRTTEGSLFIDLIDAKTNSLVWQGKGTASLIGSSDIEAKEQRINEIVTKILSEYPPRAINK